MTHITHLTHLCFDPNLGLSDPWFALNKVYREQAISTFFCICLYMSNLPKSWVGWILLWVTSSQEAHTGFYNPSLIDAMQKTKLAWIGIKLNLSKPPKEKGIKQDIGLQQLSPASLVNYPTLQATSVIMKLVQLFIGGKL